MVREKNNKIHLLLTDLVMPKMSGEDLVKKIQEIRPEIKILFMSGYTATSITSHGLLPEGMHFIEKPLCGWEGSPESKRSAGYSMTYVVGLHNRLKLY